MLHLSLSLFGTLEATLAGAPVTFASDKVRALLSHPTVEAGPCRQDRLVGLFWPNRSEAHAHQNLGQALLRLRQALTNDHAPSPFCSLLPKPSSLTGPAITTWT